MRNIANHIEQSDREATWPGKDIIFCPLNLHRRHLHVMKSLLPTLIIIASVHAEAQTTYQTCEQDKTKVLTRATQMSDAFTRSDMRPIVDMMYPPVVQANGGKEKYLAIAGAAMAKMAAQNLKIERVTLGEPTKTYREGTRSICFVPREMLLSFTQGRVISHGYLVAIQDPKTSAEWTFLDSDAFRQNPGLMRRLFPGLPSDVQTPPAGNERLQ